MHHSRDRRTVEALLRLQALLPGTLVRRARVRRILVDEVAGGARREHVAAKQIKIQGVGGGRKGRPSQMGLYRSADQVLHIYVNPVLIPSAKVRLYSVLYSKTEKGPRTGRRSSAPGASQM